MVKSKSEMLHGMPMSARRLCHWQLICASLLILLLAVGCKNKGPAAPAPQTTTVPAPSPATTVPPAPTKPVPTFSAAQTIGMFVYPKAGQTHDQQLIDESECYNSVQQQTGIDAQAAAPTPPSAADQNAAAQGGAAQAQQAQGGRVRGAARGAAGGAVDDNERRMQLQRKRALKPRFPSSNRPTGRPRPHTTNEWPPSNAASPPVWMHGAIR